MHTIVTFSALPTGGNTVYINTVTLSGMDFSQTDTEEKNHTVRSAGTLTGMSNAVQIQKIDRFSVTTVLPGAKFEFFECVTGDDGEVLGETSCGIFTSNDNGIVTSPSVKPGVLYCFKETEAPENYIISNSAPTYFAAYQVLNNNNRVTVPWNKLAAETRQKIQEKFTDYILIQSLTDSSTTPVFIKAHGPASSPSNEECWLSTSEYPSAQTGYSSLMQEVNAINLAEAQALVERFNSRYGEQKSAVAVETGYTWSVDNIKKDVTTIKLQASKTLTGRAMEAEEFTFQLYNDTVADESYLIQPATNIAGAADEAQTITFDDYPIVAAGTYQFRIVEVPGSADNTTYDPAVYKITVVAAYDEDKNSDTYGKLLANITKITKTVGDTTTELSEDKLTSPVPFENTYTQPSGTLNLTGTKTLIGRNMNKDEFHFTVTENGTTVATGSNAKADDGKPGTITFGTINYTAEGEHEYTITEDTPLPPYVSQKEGTTTRYTVKVSVVQEGSDLVATVVSVNGNANGTIDFTNEYNVPTIDLTGTKVWSDGASRENKDLIKLDLYRYTGSNTPEPYAIVQPTWTGNTYTFAKLPKVDDSGAEYTYFVIETVLEEGLTSKTEYTNTAAGHTSETDRAYDKGTITNTVIVKNGSLKVKKTVSGAPDSETTKTYKIRVKQGDTVYGQDGKPVAAGSDGYVTFTADDEKTWENLPIGDYTIEEDEDGAQIEIYTLAVKGTENSVKVEAGKTAEATVTNTYAPIYGSAKLTKTGKDGKPLAGAKFDLYKVVEGGTDIKVNTDALATDDDGVITVGKLIPGQSYYFVETAAPEGYILPEGDAAQTTVLTVEKDTETPAELKFTMTNEETVVWLSKVDATTEEELDGATIQIIDSEGNVVVEWVSEAGKPLEVTGLKTGEEYTLHETAAPNGYLVTSDTKFVIDEHGKVSGSATVSVDENGVQTLLVKDEMKKLSAAVKKVWEDDNDRDALREDSIEVKLLQNGETYDTVTLSAKNNWTYIATGLPAVDEKLEDYVYEWEETGTVEGYTATKKTEGILTVLTNTHGPEETAVTVKKAWNDNDNAAEKRPESVTVQLYADGQAAGKPVELNAANGWSATWDHLVKNTNEDGQAKPIVYTVAETEIPKGYTSKITGSMAAGYVITNTLETGKLVIEKQFDIQVPVEGPEEEELTTDIEVVKLWEDNDNRDGNRPASVTVHLYAGGTEVRSAELTAAGGWRKTFGGLPKFVDGRPIRYFVTEDPVEWYVPEIRGFTITNRYTPEVTSVTVKKVWNDEDNKRGRRPLSVAMKLNNGTIVLLSEENNWTETVTELPARVNGKPAEYSWTEQSSLGYVQESVETKDGVTVFTNKLWTGPEGTPAGKKPRTYGETLYNIGEYKTPLGVNEIINHVGDCFD